MPGSLQFSCALRSRQEPILELPLTGAASQKATSLTFNPKQRGLLGVGVGLSIDIQRWKIPDMDS